MEINSQIVLVGTAFTFFILLLAAIVVISAQKKKAGINLKMQNLELKRQKEISENTLLSQEEERQRISLELHDELGPTFAAVRLTIDRIKQKINREDYKGLDKLTSQTSNDLKTAISQFSDVSRKLYPVILNRHGLTEALNDIIDKANAHNDIQFTMSNKLASVNKEVIKLSLFRICQELTTNASKHSKAKNVTLDLFEENKIIHLIYKDDGVGFDTSNEYEGLGLNSIKGRVEAIGGEQILKSAPNKGLTVKINIPND